MSRSLAPFGRTLAPCSIGLWRRRTDLRALFPGHRIRPPGTGVDRHVGWGWRPSGLRARALARGAPDGMAVLEDGFVSGFSPRRGEPPLSYIVDTRGPHYDATRPTDLERSIQTGGFTAAERSRAEALMERLRERHLSKWNDAAAPTPEALGLRGPYLLLIDQVEGDLSLEYGAAPNSFTRMLAHAREIAEGRSIVVRAHPVAPGPLARLAAGAPDVRILSERTAIGPLLAGADAVLAVSSHAGFEALMHGRPVHLFGTPFYAGWGLTENEAPVPRRTARRSVADLFVAAYLRHSRYLDWHERRPIEMEAALDQLELVRRTRLALRPRVASVGMSVWKRRVAAPFLIGPGGRPEHYRAGKLPADFKGDVALWGADAPMPERADARAVRLEDGFLRSRGLGAALNRPYSLMRAMGDALHFDARAPNAIERELLDDPPGDAERLCARALIDRITTSGATKYMLVGERGAPLPEPDGRTRILVVGQVEGDASLRHGAPDIDTNTALIEAVRALHPGALIAYRDHPDVLADLREGRADRTHVDLDVDGYPLPALFEWADRVETMTSLSGFEALLRGLRVGTHGWPFYAGWGLTDDRLHRTPRGATDLESLVAVAMLRCAPCIHPQSLIPCTPERLLDALEAHEPGRTERAVGTAREAAMRMRRRMMRLLGST